MIKAKPVDAEEILGKQLRDLGLSDRFCEKCRAMGFEKLEDICFMLPEQLVAKPGFTYEWLSELITYLNERQLLYLLQPIPGKNYG